MDSIEKATKIIKKLVREGHVAYFAGGWVRDYLMGHPSSDIDIATDAPPEKILDLFSHTIPVGIAFGVIIVVMDGHAFEVTTFRSDIDYLDGRKPTRIEHSNPQDDALRRDFTINGMFYDPLEKVVYDYVMGQEDIKRGVVRTIGDPFERFFEDRLRMIRAVRFAARFGFSIEAETQQAIKDYANTLFPAVAMERIWQELEKMAESPRFNYALVELHRLGLLPVIFPALEGAHLNDVKRQVSLFPVFPANTPTMVYLNELFPNASLEQMLALCQYLRTSIHEMNVLKFVHQHRENILKGSLSKREWVYFYAHPQAELCIQTAAARLDPADREPFLYQIEKRRRELQEHIERVEQKKPLVDGGLLKKHGISQGIKMGMLLKEVEDLIIQNDLQDPEEAIAILKRTTTWTH